ncbi:MAG: c-type cytochrome [Verrucomicrobiales bacterium]
MRKIRLHVSYALVALAFLTPPRLLGQSGDREGHVMEPPPAHWDIPEAPVVGAADAAKTIDLEPGFELELVASEPMIHDPVALAFDGNGRIWVAEMQGYMPDIEGKGEDETYGRISVLEDTDGDGKADKHTVFLEDYLLPRAVALVDADRTLLFADNTSLYEAAIEIDDEGNIRPGKVSMIDEDYAEGGNPEHKPNGLMPALDNWIYNAKSDTRYRKVDGRWLQEKTEDRGQWGIAQDDYGRLLTNTNSNLVSVEEIPPGLTRRNPHYEFRSRVISRVSDQRVWPSRITPGVNRGYMEKTLTDEGYLATPTAASGMAIYRGDQYPEEYLDNIFVTEPAGNLVKRLVSTTKEDGFREIESAYEDREFLTSTDERSRMVNAYNAPDGTLYLVDFYRGIIQHEVYMTSYLRAQVEERGLDTPIGLGRIWRVRHAGENELAAAPWMQEESSTELVAHLSSRNGWWRDTAQRIIVERGSDEAVDTLGEVVADSENPLAKIHAVWTLEGLGRLTPAVLESAVGDSRPRVVAEAIRAAETLARSEDAEAVFGLIESAAESDNVFVRRQVAASAGLFGKKALPLLAKLVVDAEDDILAGDLAVSGLGGSELAFFETLPADHGLRLPLVETLVRRNDRNELRELAASLESPREHETLGQSLVSMRRTEAVKDLLAGISRAESSPAVRDAVVAGMIGAGKDKKFKPMPVKEISVLDKLAEADGVKAGDLEKLARLFEVGSGKEAVFLATAAQRRQFKEGEIQYHRVCMACHQTHGKGQQYLAPPLVGAEWVLESRERLIALVMDGVTGPIEVLGKTYTAPEIQPLMPGLRLNREVDDGQLAAILTYVRNAWGNGAPPISEEEVSAYRASTEERGPWTPEELMSLK